MPRIGLFRGDEPARFFQSGNPLAFETVGEAKAWASPGEVPGVLKDEHWPTKARSVVAIAKPAPAVERQQRAWWQKGG